MGNLESAVCSLLRSCDIDCYEISGNIKMKDLGIEIDNPDQVIEFDILAIVENTGIIFEVTTQTKGNKKKIDEFMSKCNLLMDAHNHESLNFGALPNVPNSVKDQLTRIKEWRFVYVGTSKEMETNRLDRTKFPNSENLAIINSSVLRYLEYLRECLGKYAKNDIFAHLRINPKDPEDPEENITLSAIHLKDKKISGTINADMFFFHIPAKRLLNLARVLRHSYEDAPSFHTEETNYQRILKKDKLQEISKTITKGGRDYSFPNAVTLVLPDTVKISGGKEEDVKKITIPCDRRSINVIDGQHRIFGYAKSDLSQQDLEKCRIMAIGLRFAKSDNQNRDEAKIFVEVNKQQTKVPKDLLLLLGYPVLGETTPDALSATVLAKLNTQGKGPLQNRLATKSDITKKHSIPKPIEIVMISNSLSKMFKADKKLQDGTPEEHIEYLFDLTSQYFKILKSNFTEDWNHDNESLIFSSKYLAGFVKLLVEYKKKDYGIDEIGNKIKQLKRNLLDGIQREEKYQRTKIIFSRDHEIIPDIKEDQTTIANFILNYTTKQNKEF